MYKRIKDLREDQDLSQAEISKILHVSQSTYSRYESGVLDISAASLEILAEFYKTSIDYLLGLTDVREPYPHKK